MVWKSNDGVAECLSDGIIFHSHIPKTAGTSLLKAVRDALPPGNFVRWNPTNPYNIDRSLHELKEVLEANPSVKVVHGHFLYGMHQALGGRPYKYFSIMRDPVARVFSHYKHAIQHNFPAMGPDKAFRIIDLSIEDAVRQPDISYFYNNIQARFISGLADPNFDGRSGAEVLDLCAAHIRSDYCYLGSQSSIATAVADLSDLLGDIDLRERADNARGRMNARMLLSADQVENLLSQNTLDISLLSTFCPETEFSGEGAVEAEEDLAEVMLDTYKTTTKNLLHRLSKVENTATQKPRMVRLEE